MASGFSRNPIGRLIIHHVEKVILGVGVVAIFIMLYFGMNTKSYNKKPSELSKNQQVADNYIAQNDSWDKIQNLRLARTGTLEDIQNSESNALDHSKYQYGYILSTRLKTLGLRMDPELKPVQDMMAQVMTAPIVINGEHEAFKTFLTSVDSGYKPKDEDEEDSGDGGGLDGSGLGAGGTGGDYETGNRKKDDEETGPKSLPASMQVEMPLNPVEQFWKSRGSSSGKTPVIREFVCVTGLVPYESQWKEFDAKLRDAKGWYPLRDRPSYEHLEIQRKEADGEWVDITEDLKFVRDNRYAKYKSGLVPEFVDKKFLHPVLSQLIPPLLNTNYRDVAMHPGVTTREFFKDEKKKKVETKEKTDAKDAFDVKKSDKSSPFSKKGDGKKGIGKKSTAKKGMRDEDPTIQGGSGGAQALPGMGQSTMASMDEIQSEFLQELPSSEYKLVRFFDPTVEVGKTYQYRVRVWLVDPNNPDNSVYSKKGGTSGDGMSAPSAGGGMAAPSAGGGGSGAGAGIGGDFTGGSRDTGSMNADGKSSAPGLADIQFRPLKSSDLDPRVRDRIKDWEDKVNSNPKLVPRPELRNARPTPWSEPTAPVTVKKSDTSFVAGGASRRDYEEVRGIGFYKSDPFVSMLIKNMDRDLGVEIPTERRVWAGDLLNYRTNTRFVHPLDWTIHQRNNLTVESNAVVVGIAGGERLNFTVARIEKVNKRTRPVYLKQKTNFAVPADVLIMDESGNFQVRNELDDRTAFRMGKYSRSEELDGKPREIEPKDDEEEEGGRRGRRGGGGSDF